MGDTEQPEQAGPAESTQPSTVAIVGSGSIGVAWAIVFASAGHRVRLHDENADHLSHARAEVADRLGDLLAADLLNEPVADVLARVVTEPDLAAALRGVDHVQECAIEDLEVKKALFARFVGLAPAEAVLASSTSTIPASRFAADLSGRDRCLVVHPGNPPYILRIAEVVPAEFTSVESVERTRCLLLSSGMVPVVLGAEIEGFVFNRLQGVLLREAFCLVRDGIVSPLDLDLIVREGLGRRWSVVGPFATAELNTRGGLRRHARILGDVYARIAIDRAGENPWTVETVEKVALAIESALPHTAWVDNVRERDQMMIALGALHRSLVNQFSVPAASSDAAPLLAPMS